MSLKGEAYCWGVVVGDTLHNAEVVVYYEIMTSYVPSMLYSGRLVAPMQYKPADNGSSFILP